MAETQGTSIRFGRVAPMICVWDILIACDFSSRVPGFSKMLENGSRVGFIVPRKDAAELHLREKRDHVTSTVSVAHMFVDAAASLYAVCETFGVRIVKRLMNKDYDQHAFEFADPDSNRIDIGERIDLPMT